WVEARGSGVDAVVRGGGIGWKEGGVNAAMAAKLGLACHLILNGSSEEIPASRYLDELYGAIIHPVRLPGERGPAMQRIASELQAAGAKTMEIPLGASEVLGALGYVAAAEEIYAAGMRFDAIFHCSSSGGTQAGLDVGLQLFGMSDVKLIGVSVDESAASICEWVSEIRDGLAAKLGIRASRPLCVDDRFTGEGYGIASPEGDEATRLLARTEGVVLDPVYT